MKETFLKILLKAKSWSDIYQDLAKINNDNPKLAGTLFEHFCKYYYLAESKVASDYKNVWLYEEAPHKIKEKLNIAKQDHGVDLILVDHEDAFTVVQCKFRNDQSSRLSWTKDKIANLFAEADKADFIIVFSNASNLDEYSKNKQAKKFHLVTLGELITISAETIQRIVKLIKDKPIKEKPSRKPREHQITAIKAVLKGFQSHDRGQLILPCGAGKTLTALWIKEQLKPKHTLVLVPSLALLRQIKDEWHSTQEKWVPYLCVCSERDIDNITDAPIVHTYEIGGRVTTEIQEIRNFLKQHKETIIYSTYQSLDTISNAIHLLDFKFDFAICDEAHKTAGSKISTFGLIHQDEKVPVKKRLYMTATPRIVSEQAKSKLDEDQIRYLADMSDPTIFGPEFHRMSFAEAIKRKILVDYQIIAIGVSDAELQQQILERQFAGDDETTIEDIANNYALEKVMIKHGATHAITFHSSIKRAEQFKERHEKIYPNILTDHVSGLQTTNDRNLVMDRFRNSPKAIITNARCLTEGVDVPTIDIVYFCDPKNSKIDIVQASGRALRHAQHKNKQFGYIVVPIFHRSEEETENVVETSAFKNLITVVRALCDQDERLVDEINKIKIGKGVRRPSVTSINVKIEDELQLVVLENFEEKLEKNLFLNAIEKIPIPWRRFEEAKEFAQGLHLNSQSEWQRYCQFGMKGIKPKPPDIPVDPRKVYKGKGWISFGDWLGTGKIADQLRAFRTFEEARLFARSLGLKNQHEWRNYCKGKILGKESLPSDIPATPDKTYKNRGWIGIGDWLGTGNIANFQKKFRSFENARKFVHTLNIKGETEWHKYCRNELTEKGKRPTDIPWNPQNTYKNQGWVNWGDWFGTDAVATIHRKYLPFSKARSFVQKLKLKSETQWRKYCKGELPEKGYLPKLIPSQPNTVYKGEGWSGMGDWLGTGTVATNLRQYRSFIEAKKFVNSLKLKSRSEWSKYCKGRLAKEKGFLPKDIPAAPWRTYKNNGWISMGEWLGTGKVANFLIEYRPFKKARKFAQNLKLQSNNEWHRFCKGQIPEKGNLPEDVPNYPQQTYKNKGWIDWYDWLGKSR